MTIPPKTVFQNQNFIVLDKPVGLTVNRSQTTKGQETLQDYLEKNFEGIANYCKKNPESEFAKRSGIVHRLDKDTSGIILIAKTPQSLEILQKQFKEREVKKTYLALVWGKLTQSGEINAPITRNPFNRSRFGVFLGGKEAQTKYTVCKNSTARGKDITLLEVYPETGRTHQIRVHLTYIGHPIVGDSLYSGRKMSKEGLQLFGRLMLHAYKLSFIDPVKKIRQEFKSDIPEEFRKNV